MLFIVVCVLYLKWFHVYKVCETCCSVCGIPVHIGATYVITWERTHWSWAASVSCIVFLFNSLCDFALVAIQHLHQTLQKRPNVIFTRAGSFGSVFHPCFYFVPQLLSTLAHVTNLHNSLSNANGALWFVPLSSYPICAVMRKIGCEVCRHKQSTIVDRKTMVLPGGEGTPIYWLYGYEPLERIWFSSHLVWYKV